MLAQAGKCSRRAASVRGPHEGTKGLTLISCIPVANPRRRCDCGSSLPLGIRHIGSRPAKWRMPASAIRLFGSPIVKHEQREGPWEA